MSKLANGKKTNTALPEPKDFLNGELIDLRQKGNVVRLYFGKNGEQKGDDWDDAPYEHNAGLVYDEFVNFTIDVALPFEVELITPATDCCNSEYCREDFREMKVYAFKLAYDDWECETEVKIRPREIYFGDTWGQIKEILEDFCAVTIAGDHPKGWKGIFRTEVE